MELLPKKSIVQIMYTREREREGEGGKENYRNL
jgi:hypothetical protein